MAILPVNPTRMELTRLKKRLVTARRGHKLLKDKRDELMRQFLETVRETKKLRRSVESRIVEANNHMSVARSLMQNEVLAVKVAGPEEGALAQQTLAEQFADNGFKLIQEDTVGPQVGKELQRSGLIAIGLSLVGMIVYITIRFEFSFAVGGWPSMVCFSRSTWSVFGS